MSTSQGSGASQDECNECGAPRGAGLAACSYCHTAYPGIAGAVKCPRCGDQNLPGNAACVSCQASLAVSCVFCGSASPLGAGACTRCGEAFAGAAERKRARDEQAQQAQMMNLAGAAFTALGSVAAEVIHEEHHAHGGGYDPKHHKESAASSDGGLLGVLENLIDEATKG